MSLPARIASEPLELDDEPRPGPGLRDTARQVPSRRSPLVPAARPLPASPPSLRRRARRGSAPFWVVTALVVGSMVVAIVSVSAMFVQASFAADATRARIAELTTERAMWAREVAELSAPGRVAAWARERGMEEAERVVILRVPGSSGDPAA